MLSAKKIPLEQKQQILSEVKQVGNVKVVAKKHGISGKSIYRWIQAANKGDELNHSKELRSLNKKLKDAELENEVLKALLKKTYPHWQNAGKL